jgi:hypothetical protein
MARLELARQKPHAPQACAYTNSATSASPSCMISHSKLEMQSQNHIFGCPRAAIGFTASVNSVDRFKISLENR